MGFGSSKYHDVRNNVFNTSPGPSEELFLWYYYTLYITIGPNVGPIVSYDWNVSRLM